jgi:hypothetical protein
MSEEVIYSDNNVSVTTSRIMIRGTTYALRNITSVKMTITPARQGCAVALIVAGVICAATALGSKSGAAPALALGGLIAGVGILGFFSSKPEYHVTIASSSGEVRALSAKNEAYIKKVVDAVNEAIVRYR